MKKHKVLINGSYGGYEGSWPRAALQTLHLRYPEVIARLVDHGEDVAGPMIGPLLVMFDNDELVGRHDPRLIEIAEEFNFNDDKSHTLEIQEIEGSEYAIREYDGMEWIVQPQFMEWVKIEKADTFRHLKSCDDDEL
jgi:hypothetical protein